jgi:hypothetical protein
VPWPAHAHRESRRSRAAPNQKRRPHIFGPRDKPGSSLNALSASHLSSSKLDLLARITVCSQIVSVERFLHAAHDIGFLSASLLKRRIVIWQLCHAFRSTRVSGPILHLFFNHLLALGGCCRPSFDGVEVMSRRTPTPVVPVNGVLATGPGATPKSDIPFPRSTVASVRIKFREVGCSSKSKWEGIFPPSPALDSCH